ncbi:peptidyl-prolyl cis-trans isomerase [Desulfurobacterium crinifex]
MKKLLTAVTVISLLAGCSNPSNNSSETISKKEPVCTSETPLAKIDGKTITVAYYERIEDSIPKWVMKRYYFGEKGKEKLLQKIVDRQLIVLYAQEKGFLENPEVKKRLEKFKIKQLAYRYLNSKVGDVKVSDEELQKAIEKYYKGKKVTPELKKAIRINLEAQKFQSKRNQILEEIEKEIKFKQKDSYMLNDIVATYDGITVHYKDVKPILSKNSSQENLREAVTYYVLSKLAEKEGLNKKEVFLVAYNRLMEDLAVKDFEKRILSKVKVTDKEIKEYYEKHKSELRTPERADIEIFEFPDENEAKKALSAIEKGKSLKEAIPKNIYSTLKKWKVTAADVDRNPVSALVFKEKNKDANILVMPDGRTLLVIVKKRYPSKTLLYGDAYSKIKRMLTTEKARKLAEEEIEKLKEKYEVKVFKENLKCVE